MKRYAVYYAPPPGEFGDRAAAWLGRDAQSGAVLTQPETGLDLQTLTADPRRYGFHATLKAPFRLAPGKSAADLDAALRALANGLAPAVNAGLRLSRIGRFLALTPAGDPAAIMDLASAVVRGLAGFHAPLSAAELARRRPDQLTPRQRELLDLWGYPYVMEEFRFHLTLSERLDDDIAAPLQAAAAQWFAPVLPTPFTIADLCLFGEPEDGAFRLLHRYPLGS